MTDARTDILARLRAARDREPAPAAPDPTPPPQDPPAPDPTPAPHDPTPPDPVALLVDRLLDYRAAVHRCTSAGLAECLAAVLDDAPRVAVPADLPQSWLAGYPGTVVRDSPTEPLTVAALDVPGLAAVTGCAVAIGQTGTVLLDAGPAQGPRRLTLVPDRHVCVVRAEQVADSVGQALARLTDPTRPITLISGPSATSDIELNRVEGVHGPRRLDVVLVEAAQPAGTG